MKYVEESKRVERGGGKEEEEGEDGEEDGEEEEADAEESGRNEEMRRRILGKRERMSEEEMMYIAKNPRLREVYQYREWYRDEDNENYLVFYNASGGYVEPGKQIYYNYGRRSNSYLI